MSIVEKAVAKAGMELRADTLPKQQRTVKCFQRLIAAMRATEAEVQESLSQSERELNEALLREARYQDRIRILENEVIQYRLTKEMDSFEKLTVADRTKLLTAASVNGS